MRAQVFCQLFERDGKGFLLFLPLDLLCVPVWFLELSGLKVLELLLILSRRGGYFCRGGVPRILFRGLEVVWKVCFLSENFCRGL